MKKDGNSLRGGLERRGHHVYQHNQNCLLHFVSSFLLSSHIIQSYTYIIIHLHKPRNSHTHSLGSLNASTNLCSLLPFSGSYIYLQLAVSGKLIKILSTLALGVFNPNAVPRSCTRLNSTYRPRRTCCHSLSFSVYGISLRLRIMGM